jgi:hypothetical protein
MKITMPRLLTVAALATGALILGAAQQGGIGPLWRTLSVAVASMGRSIQERIAGTKEGGSTTDGGAAAGSGSTVGGVGSPTGATGPNAVGGASAAGDEAGMSGNAAAKTKEINPLTTPAAMRERAVVMAKIKDKESLSAEFRLFVGDLNAGNWVEAFEGVYPLFGKGLLGPNTWEALMAKIGELAGKQAMEKFRPTNSLMNYEAFSARFAMQSWATKDIEAAKEYFLTLPDGRFKDGMGIGLFQAMAGRNRASLEGLFQTLPEPYWNQIATNLRDVIRWESGPNPVPTWLQQTEATLGKDSAQYRAVKQAADLHDLEHAEFSRLPLRVGQLAAGYFANPTEVSDRVLSTSALALAGSQPGQAMDYVVGLGIQRPALTATVPGIVSAWAKADLGAPGEWLNGNPQSPLYDDTAVAYVKELKSEDPTAARQWAQTINDPARKQALLKLIDGK